MSDRNLSPDSGQHWADEGAWPAAPGVHRIPLPLPTDGFRAVNVYAIETDGAEGGLTLVDGGWAIDAGRAALDKGLAQIGYAASDIRRFLVTHVHRDHYTQAVVVRREFGSRIALGLADKPTLDRVHEGTDDNRIGDLLHDAGAADLAERWVRLVDGPSPDTVALGLSRRVARGRRRPRGRGPHAARRGDARAHPRALRVRRAGRRAAVRRRPRAADDHTLDRLRAGAGLTAARRLPVLADQGTSDAGRPAAAGARPGRAVGARPGRRAPRPPRRAAVAVPERLRLEGGVRTTSPRG